MADDDERSPTFADPGKKVVGERIGGLAVEAGRRFVGEDDLWVVGERPGHRHALAFAAREGGDAAGVLRDAEAIKQGSRGGAECGAVLLRGKEGLETGVLGRAQLVEEKKILEDHTCRLCPEGCAGGLGKVQDVSAIPADFSGGAFGQTCKREEECGFAGAGRPSDPERGAGGQVE